MLFQVVLGIHGHGILQFADDKTTESSKNMRRKTRVASPTWALIVNFVIVL
jgi:hypothetical protein